MESVWLSSKIAGPSPLPLIHHSATTITERKIVILGGPSQGQKLRILNAAGLRAWTDAKATGVGPVQRILHRCMAVPLSSTDEFVFLFGGCTEDESKYFNDAFTLNTRTMTWACVRVQGALPMPRCGHSQNLSTVNNVILGWVFGGKYLTKVMNELICVHFAKGQIAMIKLDKFKIVSDDSTVTELPQRTLHAAAVIQKENSASLFVIGGKGSKDEVFNDVWEIELPASQVPTISTEVTCRRISFKGNFLPRYDHACEVLDGSKIVVYGGVGADGRDMDDLLMFDTYDHTWYKCSSTNASAPGPRHGHAMTLLNKQVYLMGGDTSSSEVHVLQLEKVQWEPLSGTATLTKPRASSRARVTPHMNIQTQKSKSSLSTISIAGSTTNKIASNTNVPSAATSSNTNVSYSNANVTPSYETVPVKTFPPTATTPNNNNNAPLDYNDTSDSPAIARVPHPGSFKASPNTNAPSASPLSKFSLAPDPAQMTPPSSPSVPAAVATSGTSATASSPKVATRRSVTSRGSPGTVTNATAGFGMSPKVPHHPSPNAAKVGSSRASISGTRTSFGGSPKSAAFKSSAASTSNSNIVLVSANNNNAGDESARNKSQSDKLKLENEQLKQKLETEAENKKVWQQTQVSNNTMLENELAASRQEAMVLAERVRALEQELGAALSSSTQSSNTDLELVTLNAQVNTLKFENTSLKAQLRLANSSAFQGDTSASNNNTSKAKESELSEAKAAIEQKDRELAQLRTEAEEMKKKSTESSAQEQILRAQLSSALTEVRKLSENAYINNATLKQLAELKTENEVLQTELQQQSKMKRQLLSDVEELRASMESANTNGEVVRLLAENTQLTAQMISLQNEYQELDITLHKVQASHVELQSEFDSLRVQQLNGTSGQSDSNLVALEQELKQKQAEVQQLTDEVQQWSQAAAQLQIVNEEMVRELQQEIHELNKELQELSDAYQQELDRRIKAEEELIAAEAKMTEIEGIFSKFVGGSSANPQ